MAEQTGLEVKPLGEFFIQERDDDMLIAERCWQFGNRCIARRPRLLTNEEWRPTAQRIVAALAVPAPQPGWQTMDTAPKDGTRILLWMVHDNAKYSKHPVEEGWEAAVIAEWIDHNGGGWTWHGLFGRPTHWRHLPASPRSAGQ
ncbi:hypothetical protein [Allomesorhizobium camelthorni]|uniref:DUF551 domain-containing protein n=1 Tax=Allomesorhizobium camelthorni TaxID=475069 RepID=A0A6G4W6W6_9HYPH|nr:hypothetical protein [Mesorhizobium camelthorni]NGO50491.1 hypothetical protein [Mesorhizobium camelthorni]